MEFFRKNLSFLRQFGILAKKFHFKTQKLIGQKRPEIAFGILVENRRYAPLQAAFLGPFTPDAG